MGAIKDWLNNPNLKKKVTDAYSNALEKVRQSSEERESTRAPTYDEIIAGQLSDIEASAGAAKDYAGLVKQDADAYAEKAKSDADAAALAYKTAADERALLDKQESEALAQSELSRQNIAANDAYERSKMTYGQFAEMLAQGGLTGSGYSDNLTRDAYAQRAGAISDANLAYGRSMQDAAGRYQTAVGDSELAYQGALRESQSALDKSLYENKAAYDRSIYDIGENERSQISAIEADRFKRGQEIADAYSRELANVKSGLYTPSEIEELARSKGFSPEQTQALIEASRTYHRENTFKDLESRVTSGDFKVEDADAALRNGTITQPEYDSLKKEFQKNVVTSTKAFEGLTYDEAKKLLEEYESHKWITQEQKNKIRRSFEKRYSATIGYRMDNPVEKKEVSEETKELAKAIIRNPIGVYRDFINSHK